MLNGRFTEQIEEDATLFTIAQNCLKKFNLKYRCVKHPRLTILNIDTPVIAATISNLFCVSRSCYLQFLSVTVYLHACIEVQQCIGYIRGVTKKQPDCINHAVGTMLIGKPLAQRETQLPSSIVLQFV